jgi:2-iminobutanoate/2-iminopropanoate deaminase
MTKVQIFTPLAPEPTGPYSQAIVAGSFVFLAAQVPRQADGELLAGTFVEQAHLAFDNLKTVAAAADASLADAVRVGVFLRDMSNVGVMNEIYERFFSAPVPARTTVQSQLPGFEIAVDATLFVEG